MDDELIKARHDEMIHKLRLLDNLAPVIIQLSQSKNFFVRLQGADLGDGYTLTGALFSHADTLEEAVDELWHKATNLKDSEGRKEYLYIVVRGNTENERRVVWDGWGWKDVLR